MQAGRRAQFGKEKESILVSTSRWGRITGKGKKGSWSSAIHASDSGAGKMESESSPEPGRAVPVMPG